MRRRIVGLVAIAQRLGVVNRQSYSVGIGRTHQLGELRFIHS